MAIGDNYVSRAELKTYMNYPQTDHDTDIDNGLASISREIERHCHRQFNKDAAVAARVYEPDSCSSLIVDDFYSITGLIVKTDEDGDGVYETTWTSADYRLKPQNNVMQGMPGWPYYIIKPTGRNGLVFKTGYDSAQITAPWGWNAVPAPVKQAAYILGADTFQLKDQRLGVAGSDAFGTIIRVSDNRLAANKLKKFCRDTVLVDG